MCVETPEEDVESMRLPKNWHALIRTAVLNVMGIVRIALLTGREALIKYGDSKDARIHQLESEVAMLREELRITGARMRQVPPNRRPQYTAMERMAILQLRAMRGWSKAEVSRHFLVSDDTIREWLRRADDDSLVQAPTPVNRFPAFQHATRGLRPVQSKDEGLTTRSRSAERNIEVGHRSIPRSDPLVRSVPPVAAEASCPSAVRGRPEPRHQDSRD